MENTRENLMKLLIKANNLPTLDRETDFLIANGVTVQEWIPVTERLPEENTAVMTYRESGIQVEFRWYKGWDNDEFTPCQVTHWMPLPQPPKGE
jgi:hypothetical protein